MPDQSGVVREETFAPILYTLGYDTLDEAIAIQNDVPQGLSSSIFTLNLREAESVSVGGRVRLRDRQRQHRPLRRRDRRSFRRREGDRRRPRERLRRLESLHAPTDEHGELFGQAAARAGGAVRFLTALRTNGQIVTEINIQPEDQAVFDRLKSTGHITHGLRRAMTQQWNKCAICNIAVSPGRPAFAGYGVNDVPLLVGSCCAGQLAELATPVYWTDSLNLSVDDQQHVWRFMDLAKFVAMLRQRGLYFARADKLEDRFEAAVGLAYREPDWDRHYLNFFREAVTTAPPGLRTVSWVPTRWRMQQEGSSKTLKASRRKQGACSSIVGMRTT